MPCTDIIATYEVRATAAQIDARAQALAVEQSIEMPPAAVTNVRVLREVLAKVRSIEALDDGLHRVQLALAREAVGDDAGQLMNMLFGNSALLEDVSLTDVDVPPALAALYGGPRLGSAGLRQATGAGRRAMTCTALKPIGASLAELAQMAAVFARAGIDVIKDDHGWADPPIAPFAARLRVCQAAVDAANRGRAMRSIYAPSLSGSLDKMRAQLQLAVDHGVAAALIAPMNCGPANFQTLRAGFPQVAFIAHPAQAGRHIAPPVLLGKLLRLFGADAVIFPNHGGRFTYPRATCQAIAHNCRAPWHDLPAALPTPAGGMSVERVPELVADYGHDAMLLIGGSLLIAGARLAERSAQFVHAVAAAGTRPAAVQP